MKNNEYGYIIRYYFKSLIKDAEKMKKGFDGEAIHLFRVVVKKLRAYMRMMRPAAQEPEGLKFPHKFKKMYSLAGKIRDRQLYLKRIKEHDKSAGKKFTNKILLLEKEIETLVEKEEDLLTRHELVQIEKKIIGQLPETPEAGLAKRFTQQRLSTINELISRQGIADKDLHSIRKSIKDIIYITRIFKDDLKIQLPFSFWSEAELKKAWELSHKLGLFNDACIALSFLPPAEIKKTDPPEREHLQAVRRQWLREKQKIRKEILNAMPAINMKIS